MSDTYNVNSTSSINWNILPNVSNTVWTTTSSGTFDWGFPKNDLHVKGDAEFEGDIRVKGKSIVESLEKIEERLAIIHRNQVLEEKWEELRDLAKKYRALEKEILEKEKIWNLLEK